MKIFSETHALSALKGHPGNCSRLERAVWQVFDKRYWHGDLIRFDAPNLWLRMKAEMILLYRSFKSWHDLNWWKTISKLKGYRGFITSNVKNIKL